MAFPKKSALSIILVLALVAASFLQFHASIDLPERDGNHVVYSSGIASEEACCNLCRCIRTNPRRCQCFDVKPSCHPSCRVCACGIPGRCRCSDLKDRCDKKCPSAYSLF